MFNLRLLLCLHNGFRKFTTKSFCISFRHSRKRRNLASTDEKFSICLVRQPPVSITLRLVIAVLPMLMSGVYTSLYLNNIIVEHCNIGINFFDFCLKSPLSQGVQSLRVKFALKVSLL